MAFDWSSFWQDGVSLFEQTNMEYCMLGVGPKADFPAAAAGLKKAMAWASDEQKLYYCTGAAWVAVAPGLVADADILNMVAAPSVVGSGTHNYPGAETSIVTLAIPQVGGLLRFQATFYLLGSGGNVAFTWRLRDGSDALVSMYGDYYYGSASTPGPFGRGSIAASSLTLTAGSAQDLQGHFAVLARPASTGNFKLTVQVTAGVSAGGSNGFAVGAWHN